MSSTATSTTLTFKKEDSETFRFACIDGTTAIVQDLLNYYCNNDITDENNGTSTTSMVEQLIATPNRNGWTSMHYACYYNQIPIVQTIVQHMIGTSSITPSSATSASLVHLTTIFISQNKAGDTPLHCAVNEGHTDVVQYIIHQLQQLTLGTTTASSSNSKMLSSTSLLVLLCHTIKNNRNETILDIAKRKQQKMMVHCITNATSTSTMTTSITAATTTTAPPTITVTSPTKLVTAHSFAVGTISGSGNNNDAVVVAIAKPIQTTSHHHHHPDPPIPTTITASTTTLSSSESSTLPQDDETEKLLRLQKQFDDEEAERVRQQRQDDEEMTRLYLQRLQEESEKELDQKDTVVCHRDQPLPCRTKDPDGDYRIEQSVLAAPTCTLHGNSNHDQRRQQPSQTVNEKVHHNIEPKGDYFMEQSVLLVAPEMMDTESFITTIQGGSFYDEMETYDDYLSVLQEEWPLEQVDNDKSDIQNENQVREEQSMPQQNEDVAVHEKVTDVTEDIESKVESKNVEVHQNVTDGTEDNQIKEESKVVTPGSPASVKVPNTNVTNVKVIKRTYNTILRQQKQHQEPKMKPTEYQSVTDHDDDDENEINSVIVDDTNTTETAIVDQQLDKDETENEDYCFLDQRLPDDEIIHGLAQSMQQQEPQVQGEADIEAMECYNNLPTLPVKTNDPDGEYSTEPPLLIMAASSYNNPDMDLDHHQQQPQELDGIDYDGHELGLPKQSMVDEDENVETVIEQSVTDDKECADEVVAPMIDHPVQVKENKVNVTNVKMIRRTHRTFLQQEPYPDTPSINQPVKTDDDNQNMEDIDCDMKTNEDVQPEDVVDDENSRKEEEEDSELIQRPDMMDQSVTITAEENHLHSSYTSNSMDTMGNQLIMDQSVTIAPGVNRRISRTISYMKDNELSREEIVQWNDLFMTAVRSRDLDTTKLCIETGCIDVDRPSNADENGYTALQLACSNNQLEMLTFLVEDVQADVSTKSFNGSTALHVACKHGHFEIVQYLHDFHRGEVECCDNAGNTALHCACESGNYEIVVHLITLYHVKVNVRNTAGMTALDIACMNGWINIVSYISERYVTDDQLANARITDIISAYLMACKFAQFEIVKLFLKNIDVQVDSKNEDGMTALHFACQFGDLQHIVLLVDELKADIHLVNSKGETARSIAQRFGHHNVVEFLSKHPQNVKIQPLGVLLRNSAKLGDLDVVIDAISKGADVNSTGSSGKTALHYAIANGHLEVVQYLVVVCSADVNVTADNGMTALHYATSYGHVDCVRFLLDSTSVDLHAVDRQGESAYKLAEKCRFVDIMLLLRNATDNQGKLKSHEEDSTAYPNNDKSKSLEDGSTSYPVHGIPIAQAILLIDDTQFAMKRQTDPSPSHSASLNLPTSSNLVKKRSIDPSAIILSNGDDKPKNSFDFDIDVKPSDGLTSSKHVVDNDDEFLDSASDNDNGEAPTLNTIAITEMINNLKLENQKMMKLLKQSSRQSLSGNPTDLSWLTAERKEIIDRMMGERLRNQNDEEEQKLILASPRHRDFYLLLSRKLYCMINSCENLSTGMVPAGSRELVKAYTSRMIQDNHELRNTAIGLFVSTAFHFAKEKMHAVKLVGDPITGLFGAITAIRDKRNQYLATARVADFANIVKGTTRQSLHMVVEQFARYIIRAQCHLPSFPFLEQEEKFGRMKQFLVNMLGESGSTPIKEQASKAADCALAHIMIPSEQSILHRIIEGEDVETNLAEALAAATLHISIEEVRALDTFKIQHSTMIDMDQNRDNMHDIDNHGMVAAGIAKGGATFKVNPLSDDEGDDEDDFDEYSDEVFINNDTNFHDHQQNTAMAAEALALSQQQQQESAMIVEQLENKIADLEQKVEGIDDLHESINTLKKRISTNNSSNGGENLNAGNGMVYADFREQYKDDIQSLKGSSIEVTERVNHHATEIDVLKEQIRLLQQQLNESTVTSPSSPTNSTTTKTTSSSRAFRIPRSIPSLRISRRGGSGGSK